MEKPSKYAYRFPGLMLALSREAIHNKPCTVFSTFTRFCLGDLMQLTVLRTAGLYELSESQKVAVSANIEGRK